MADPTPSVVREVTIAHRDGFHTRPVMKFVDLAQRYAADVVVRSVERTGESVNGKSAMELMLLGATFGTKLRIETRGVDAEQAIAALVRLVENRFDMDV